MLKTIVIGEYTVTEAGPLEAARSVNFAAQYQQMLEAAKAKGDLATEDDLERLQALSRWMTVAACVTPRLSADDWLQISLTTIDELKRAAKELNPTWFEDDDQDPAAAEKKRERKRRKSTRA